MPGGRVRLALEQRERAGRVARLGHAPAQVVDGARAGDGHEPGRAARRGRGRRSARAATPRGTPAGRRPPRAARSPSARTRKPSTVGPHSACSCASAAGSRRRSPAARRSGSARRSEHAQERGVRAHARQRVRLRQLRARAPTGAAPLAVAAAHIVHQEVAREATHPCGRGGRRAARGGARARTPRSSLSGGTTRLTLDSGTAAALGSLGVKVAPTGPATAQGRHVRFPISGGAIDPAQRGRHGSRIAAACGCRRAASAITLKNYVVRVGTQDHAARRASAATA